MSDLWGEFYGPNAVVKEAYEKYDQETVDAAVLRELQLHLDELTPKQLEIMIQNVLEDNP